MDIVWASRKTAQTQTKETNSTQTHSHNNVNHFLPLPKVPLPNTGNCYNLCCPAVIISFPDEKQNRWILWNVCLRSGGDTEISAIYVSATLAQLGLLAPRTVITMANPNRNYLLRFLILDSVISSLSTENQILHLKYPFCCPICCAFNSAIHGSCTTSLLPAMPLISHNRNIFCTKLLHVIKQEHKLSNFKLCSSAKSGFVTPKHDQKLWKYTKFCEVLQCSW